MPPGSSGFRRLAAILKQRCPRCLQGQVFATLFRMHAQCLRCRLAFEREPGYFTGAMYLSYGVAISATAPVWLTMMWFGRTLGEVLLVMGPLLIVGSPWLFRYARVLWLHLDQAGVPGVTAGKFTVSHNCFILKWLRWPLNRCEAAGFAVQDGDIPLSV